MAVLIESNQWAGSLPPEFAVPSTMVFAPRALAVAISISSRPRDTESAARRIWPRRRLDARRKYHAPFSPPADPSHHRGTADTAWEYVACQSLSKKNVREQIRFLSPVRLTISCGGNACEYLFS